MGQKKVVLIVVPGKTDRSFYKAMFNKVFKYFGFNIVDLDSEGHENEKQKILDEIFRPKDKRKSQIYRASVLEVNTPKINSTLYTVIWPTDKKVSTSTADVLNYQAGLAEPTIDFIVTTEDAEDLSFKQRLNSLYMSITSRCQELKFEKVEQNSAYGLYRLEKENWPRIVALMLLVQGLQSSPVKKHAIEDFVISPIFEESKEELLKICSELLNKILHDSKAHKKLALLLAIIRCVASVEKVFHNTFTEKEFLDIIDRHDGLRKLIDILTCLLIYT